MPWVPSSSPEADGERLWRGLFAEERLREAWAELRGQAPQRRIRLHIDPAAPELHALPWELLRDPGAGRAPQTLAASSATPFSRYLTSSLRLGAPVRTHPLRVLVAIANPEGLKQYNLALLDAEAEWAWLEAAVAGLEVELTRLPAPCTLSALEAALRQGYHVLHLVSHGSFSTRTQQAALFLADEQDRVMLVTDHAFSEMLGHQVTDVDGAHAPLRLVFLAACQSATRSEADAFRGLAPQVVRAGVPAVIAMQEAVTIPTVRAFAATFYRQLLQHGVVDLASNEARASLLTASLPGAALPVLFMRPPDGKLFEPTAASRPTPPAPDESGFQYDVYISYVEQEPDASWVWDNLVPRLEEAGLRVAVSGDAARPGAWQVESIEEGMSAARRTIVVLSDNYLADHMARFENVLGQTMSIEEGQYRLIPLIFAPFDERQLPRRLKILVTLNLAHARRSEREWQRLIQALCGPL